MSVSAVIDKSFTNNASPKTTRKSTIPWVAFRSAIELPHRLKLRLVQAIGSGEPWTWVTRSKGVKIAAGREAIADLSRPPPAMATLPKRGNKW
jgi:hypothetical protein